MNTIDEFNKFIIRDLFNLDIKFEGCFYEDQNTDTYDTYTDFEYNGHKVFRKDNKIDNEHFSNIVSSLDNFFQNEFKNQELLLTSYFTVKKDNDLIEFYLNYLINARQNFTAKEKIVKEYLSKAYYEILKKEKKLIEENYPFIDDRYFFYNSLIKIKRENILYELYSIQLKWIDKFIELFSNIKEKLNSKYNSHLSNKDILCVLLILGQNKLFIKNELNYFNSNKDYFDFLAPILNMHSSVIKSNIEYAKILTEPRLNKLTSAKQLEEALKKLKKIKGLFENTKMDDVKNNILELIYKIENKLKIKR